MMEKSYAKGDSGKGAKLRENSLPPGSRGMCCAADVKGNESVPHAAGKLGQG